MMVRLGQNMDYNGQIGRNMDYNGKKGVEHEL